MPDEQQNKPIATAVSHLDFFYICHQTSACIIVIPVWVHHLNLKLTRPFLHISSVFDLSSIIHDNYIYIFLDDLDFCIYYQSPVCYQFQKNLNLKWPHFWLNYLLNTP